jgi:hypothetical protein
MNKRHTPRTKSEITYVAENLPFTGFKSRQIRLINKEAFKSYKHF